MSKIWLIFQFLLISLNIFVYSSVWIKQQSSGYKSWTSVTLTQSRFMGSATSDYLSYSDNGITWQNYNPGNRRWNSIATSRDGKYLISCAEGNYCYLSSDSGVTWKTVGYINDWIDAAISDDGSLIALMATYSFYYSSNGGTSWNSNYFGNPLACVAIAGDTIVVAAYYLYISNDRGLTWHIKNYDPYYTSVAISSDASRIVATRSSGYIYLSVDGGTVWQQVTQAGYYSWSSIAMSSDGMTILASARPGYLYLSIDGGRTWNAQTDAGTNSWYSVGVSPTGTHFIASTNPGYIFTMMIDCNIGSYIKEDGYCTVCPENMVSYSLNSLACTCPQNYYLQDELTCIECPSYFINYENSNSCHYLKIHSKAAIVLFIMLFCMMYLTFIFLHPQLTNYSKVYYLIIFFLPLITFLLHIIYWLMEPFRSKVVFFLDGLTFILPIFSYCRIILNVKSFYFVPKSYYQLYKIVFWLSNVEDYPGIYNEKIQFIPTKSINSSIFQIPILIILWLIALSIQIIFFIPIFLFLLWLIVSHIFIFLLGYCMYQLKILSFNYVWNIWFQLYAGPKKYLSDEQVELVTSCEKTRNEIIDIQLFNESLVSQIVYELLPHLILVIINCTQIPNKPNSLTIITLFFTSLFIFLTMVRIFYWSVMKSLPVRNHPMKFIPQSITIPLNFEKYSNLADGSDMSLHEITQVKKLLTEQNEKMRTLEETIRQLIEEKQTSHDPEIGQKNINEDQDYEQKEELIKDRNGKETVVEVNDCEAGDKISSNEQHSLNSKQNEVNDNDNDDNHDNDNDNNSHNNNNAKDYDHNSGDEESELVNEKNKKNEKNENQGDY